MRKSLKKLIDGNRRFAEGKSIHPNLGNELRSALVDGQNPFAAIIACSDSRVPVEIVFDAGIGDLFVIRSAGHVLSPETLGSLEYAVNTLGVKLVVVLGHENCGAIKSALSIYKNKKYEELTDNLKTLLSHIYPVFEKMDVCSENVLDEAIKANINYQVQDLRKNDAYLAKEMDEEHILVIGAKYSLSTGLIEFYE